MYNTDKCKVDDILFIDKRKNKELIKDEEVISLFFFFPIISLTLPKRKFINAVEEIKQFYIAPIQSASFLLERSLQSCMFLSTGFPELDKSLNGGFRTGELIEITVDSVAK